MKFLLTLGTWSLVAVITLVLLDLTLRVVFDNPYTAWMNRYLYIDGAMPRNVEDFWAYEPNGAYREVAFYSQPIGAPSFEYECRYAIDAYGFADNDEPLAAAEMVLLGDSFAFGQGGCSWIAQLREQSGKKIYNASVVGIGVEHWLEMFDYLARKGGTDRVVMLFVGHDFYRDKWQWEASQLDCLHGRRECRNEYWYPMFQNLDEVAQRVSARQGSVFERLNMWSLTYFWPERIVWDLLAPVRRIVLSDKYKKKLAALDRAMEAMRALNARAKVTLIQVNQKDEAALGRWNAESMLARRKLAETGMPIASCWVPYEQFMKRDGHPTARGYQTLTACVADLIRG